MFILSIGTYTYIQIYSTSHRCVQTNKTLKFRKQFHFYPQSDVPSGWCCSISLSQLFAQVYGHKRHHPIQGRGIGFKLRILAFSKQKKDHLGSSMFQRCSSQTFLEAQECSGFWWHRIGMPFFGWLRRPVTTSLGWSMPPQRQLHPTSFPFGAQDTKSASFSDTKGTMARKERTAQRSLRCNCSTKCFSSWCFFLLGEVIHWGIR